MSDGQEVLRISCPGCKTSFDVSDLEPFSDAECPVCGKILRIPCRFDRYLLEDLCGRGAFTTIYRASDPQLRREVAVKILTGGDDGRVPDKNIFTEAQLVAQLTHPGILPVYNCGTADGMAFLVMRYMDGGDLDALFRKGKAPEQSEILRIISAVADALRFAFRTAGVVHHDVKPSNILLSSDGEVRLGDFDLADTRTMGDISTPCSGWGSPEYVSPERLYGGGEDCRGDIFSLGVTLYESLCGKLPFGERSDDIDAAYEARREMAFPPLQLAAPGVPGEISGLVTRMLDFSPERRPGYSEIVDILEKYRKK